MAPGKVSAIQAISAYHGTEKTKEGSENSKQDPDLHSGLHSGTPFWTEGALGTVEAPKK